MIPITHRAFHLFREDAYREYCYSVDAYGSYQPASFIYLCFESFYELCKKLGLELTWPYKENLNKSNELDFPYKCESMSKNIETYGLITRLYNKKEVEEIIKFLKQGKNVICLFPGEEISLFYNSNKNKFEDAKNAFEKLEIYNIQNSFYEISNALEKVYWIEIKNKYRGRLFFTKDSHISDGFFKDGYGKNEYNYSSIHSLALNFSIFKYPLLRIEPEFEITHWSCNEPLQIRYKVYNHGPNIYNLTLLLSIDYSLEPLDALERNITLKTGQSITIPINIIPRSIAKNIIPCNFSTNKNDIVIIQTNYSLDILPNFFKQKESQLKKDTVTFDKLIKVFKNTPHYHEIKKISELMKIDINVCLNKIRTVGELITYEVLKYHNISNKNNFSNAISIIQQKKLLSARAIGYLHTIRVIDNLGSHPSGNTLSNNDVFIASFALASVVEEIITNYNKKIFAQQDLG